MIDNTCIPSYLQVQEQGVLQDNGIQTTMSLRFGEVKKIIYPSDPVNTNKRFIEYYVDVTSKDGFGGRTTVRYYTCQLVNLFGGPGDLVRYTLRPGDPGKSDIGVGAKVLVLCIDGEQARAVIVGGIRDPLTSNADTDINQGHNYFWEFNGAQQTVDKDGQLQFTFHGATNVDGTLTDDAPEAADGSFQLFDKTGSIKLATPEEDQSLYLDHGDKQYLVLVNDWNATVSGKLAFSITKDCSITTDAAMNLTATNNVVIKSAGVLTGAATDATMLGTTFRTKQAQMNQQVQQAAAQASAALNTAAAAIMAASSQPTLPSAKPMFQAAAQAIIQAATALNAIASAVSSFEGNADKYLSQVNLSD